MVRGVEAAISSLRDQSREFPHGGNSGVSQEAMVGPPQASAAQEAQKVQAVEDC